MGDGMGDEDDDFLPGVDITVLIHLKSRQLRRIKTVISTPGIPQVICKSVVQVIICK